MCLLVAIALTFLISCRKPSQSIDKGCGCNTDSVWHYATYNNFGGHAYEAGIGYSSYLHGWVIGVIIPNTQYQLTATLKVCNTDLPAVKAIMQTGGSAHISFAGKLRVPCPEDDFGPRLPESLTGFITIDSLKKL